MNAHTSVKAAVVGATGYTGAELLRLLAQHPQVETVCITSRSAAGTPAAEIFPSLRGVCALNFIAPDEADFSACDAVFFATPHAVAMHSAPQILASGVRVIDLSADFRLKDTAEWAKWYGCTHAAPQWAQKAVYGLPEMQRDKIRTAQLVANPGCYPTAVTLPLLPLLRSGCLKAGAPVIADCKSGVSGAGRNAKIANLFAEAADNLKAYGTGGHRHLPEIAQNLRSIDGKTHDLVFIPHLVPMIRGMLASIYIETEKETDIAALLQAAYAGEPFVDILPSGSPETRSVRASNICRISAVQLSPTRWLLLSVIDNLVKGAAGQAVQNLNILFGLPETAGLNAVPILP